MTQQNWHAQAVEEVLTALDASRHGLTEDEAGHRLLSQGRNSLPRPPRPSWFVRLLRQFNNILIYVLLGAAALTSLLGHPVDTAVILAVVLANAVIGFIQEGKAERAMESIRQLLAPSAAVLRNGIRTSVDAEELVSGDVVLLEAGDKVPADLRLMDSHGLKIQEAILTGESAAVEKTAHNVAWNRVIAERSCMAYSGTTVTAGQGRGVVVATGMATEMGKISGMLSEIETLSTPLLVQMNRFARHLTTVILAVAVFLLVFGYYVQGQQFADLFMAIVGISVSAIPEGLPAVLTITLAIGVQQMARRKAIVRRLPAIETLGSVSVICTDKTGTLTYNEMMVSSAVTSRDLLSVGGDGYSPHGDIGMENGRPDHTLLKEMGRVAAFCNDAALHQRDGSWEVEGDPMEGALLSFAGKTGFKPGGGKPAGQRLDTIPFDAAHRFMATLNREEGRHLVLVKGAPERLLSMCREQRAPQGGTEPMDEAYWQGRLQQVAERGERVLALAEKAVDLAQDSVSFSDLDQGLVFLGMVGLMDPPRPDALAAIAECRNAGIRVKMITGDHAGTATAIARQVGLESPQQVLTGAEIDNLDDKELTRLLPATDVFARTSPAHKLRLVMALQACGMTVAMTGDGVNDAPALKRADVGIAMGKKGSEAAKEAAELVLADDNFASIVAAVREGRTVYDNLKKVIGWTLPTSVGESMTIVVAILLGMTLPVTPVQILWINLITAATLGIALAFEPTEARTMLRPPRRPGEPLLGKVLVWHIVLVSLLFLLGVFSLYSFALARGYSLELARTIVVNALVVMEIFDLFFIRNIYTTSLNWKALRGTPVIWGLVFLVAMAQLAITYFPPLQLVFATEALPLADGLIILGLGVALFIILELEKQFRLRILGWNLDEQRGSAALDVDQ